MGTQNFARAVLSILIIGASCAAAIALATQAISKAQMRQPAAKVAKATTMHTASAQRPSID